MVKSGMIRRWQYLLCCVFLCGFGSPFHAAGQSVPLPPTSNPPILLYLTATAKDQSLAVPDRTALGVSIDKQPAQVISVAPAKEQKLLFAVLVDISKSNSMESDLVKRAAIRLIQGLTGNGSQGYLVLFNERVITSRVTPQSKEAEQTIESVQFEGPTSLYDAIGKTCAGTLSRSANPGSPRRAIILLSDGEENSSNMSFLKAYEAAEAEGVSIFSLETGSPNRLDKFALKKFSQDTGGEFVEKKNSDGVNSLLAALDRQWKVSLAPAQKPDGKLHLLAIKTSQKGVRISAPAEISLE